MKQKLRFSASKSRTKAPAHYAKKRAANRAKRKHNRGK